MPTSTELEQQLAEARASETETTRLREIKRKEDDRALRGLELSTTKEFDALKAKVDQALNAKVPSSRPEPKVRGLARTFLHHGISQDPSEYHLLETFARSDPRWGELLGLNSAAQAMVDRMFTVGIRDDGLFAALDEIETRTWRALVERARVLAGEAS